MWGNVQQQQTQAMPLQQPKDQKVYLDVQHSTDWVVAASIFVSGIISFIGFLITVYIVRKSTETQIISNQKLINSQESQRMLEIHIAFIKKGLDKVSENSSKLVLLLSNWSYKYGMINQYILQEKQKNNAYKYNADSWACSEIVLLDEIFEQIRLNIAELSFSLSLLEVDADLIKKIDEIETRIFSLVKEINSTNSFKNVQDLFIDSKKIKYDLERNLINCMKKAA